LRLRAVAKVGRTTGATMGLVVDTQAHLWIPYGAPTDYNRYAWFVDQIVVVPVGGAPTFSDSGDSGSLVFDVKTREIIGLLFAGSSNGETYVNPIGAVLAELSELLGSELEFKT